MNKKRRKINFFDIIIIVVVIAIALGAYIFTHRTKDVETKKQRYQIELTECAAGLSKQISEGDIVTDNIKNYEMGKVVKIEVSQSKRLGEDRINGVVKESVIENFEDIILTIEADVIETSTELRVPSGYVIKAGKEVAVKGSGGYAGKGYVIAVER